MPARSLFWPGSAPVQHGESRGIKSVNGSGINAEIRSVKNLLEIVLRGNEEIRVTMKTQAPVRAPPEEEQEVPAEFNIPLEELRHTSCRNFSRNHSVLPIFVQWTAGTVGEI